MMNSQHQGEEPVGLLPKQAAFGLPRAVGKHLEFCAWRALVHPAQKVVTEILPMFSVLGQVQVVTIKSLCNPEALQEGVWGVPRPRPC